VNVVPDPLSHCRLYEVMAELPFDGAVSADHEIVALVSEYDTTVGMTI
jgi:hypothetical protein